MRFLYNFGIRCYGLAVKMVSGRNVKAAKMIAGQTETFDRIIENIDTEAPYVWVHAASLGEFEQGRPFIEKLKREMPGIKILLTFFSPSGYEVRKNYSGADLVCYLPFDTPRNARRFINLVRPKAAVFVKYEFWRNYLEELHRLEIPTYLISSIFRPRQAFFKPWGGMFRKMLRCYTTIFVQDKESATLLKGIGMDNVMVTGDTRFDRVTDIMRSVHEVQGLESFATPDTFTLVVGSSWPADEDIYLPWVKSHPEVRCIIAPHEFDECRIARLRKRLGEGTVLMSEIKSDPSVGASARHVIVDCFGLLSSLYRYGKVAYIGGGFGAGIHNINEAAVYGIPVVFGPNHQKFKEAIDMIECGGGISVKDSTSLSLVMDMLLDNTDRTRRGKCAGDYIKSHLGATDRVLKMIRPAISPEA